MSYNSLFGLGSHSPDANLEGWWKLQEDAASTDVVDSSSNGRDGTLFGGDTGDISATGPNNWLTKALHFDGTNDYVAVPDDAGLRSSVSVVKTFSFWFNPATLPTFPANEFIIGKSDSGNFDGWWLEVISQGSAGRVRLGTNGLNNNISTLSGSSVFSADTWHYVVVELLFSSTCYVWIDGTLAVTHTESNSTVDDSAAYLSFGRIKWDTGNFTSSALAGVSCFSRILTSTERDESEAGPEPLNTVAPTLTIDGTSWSGTIGTWNSQSNGTATYAWEFRSSPSNTVVESGTGSSPSGAGTYSGDYYLWVRASNDGGFDSAEDSVSATETAAGGGGFTLTADAGTFTLTGTAASLLKGSVIAADSGSFALTGTDAGLAKGSRVVADSGSFSLTGTDASLRKDSRLTADPGSFALSGTDAGLIKASVLSAESGTFALTGTDATLTKTASNVLAADSGSFALTGTDATLRVERVLAADPGSFALSGTDASLVVARTLVAENGQYLLAGTDANLAISRQLIAGAGSFVLTGTDATLTKAGAATLVAEAGAFVLTGTDATLVYSGAAATGILGLRVNSQLLLLRI